MLFKLLSLDYDIPQPCFPYNTHNAVTTISKVPETGKEFRTTPASYRNCCSKDKGDQGQHSSNAAANPLL